MSGFKTTALHCLLALSILLATLFARDVSATETNAPVAIHFTFDRPPDASMAPLFLAAKDGRFGAERLNVAFNSAIGSPEALARVARGDSELALVDINELIRFRDKDDAVPIKAVFVLFNRAPYAIVARKSRGIQLLTDLDRKAVGVADSDLSIRLWPSWRGRTESIHRASNCTRSARRCASRSSPRAKSMRSPASAISRR